MSIFIVIYYIKKTCSVLLSLISFPVTCVSCGRPCVEIILCKECQTEFLSGYTPLQNRCSSCGVELLSEDGTCLECRNTNDTDQNESVSQVVNKSERLKDLKSIFPIHRYTLWKKELLFAWKMANNRSITPLLAKTVYAVLQTYYKGIPVVPVPPRKNKIKERGWDQIDDLCCYLHTFYHVRICNALLRISNEEQKKRNRRERLSNIEKNYILNPKQVSLCREVVILDDVMTTGATLQSCAKALKEGGVEYVHAVTLFYV